MSNKVFIGIITVLSVGLIGVAVMSNRNKPETPRPGVAQEDKGQKHVNEGEVTYGGKEPPTSGPHSSPYPWEYYDQELSDSRVIHNMEHGGVYISYSPDLPADQIAKIRALFSAPFSREKFQPSKALISPRKANDAPIIMSSWNRSQKFQQFDEEAMVDYYLKNIGKSPEPTAG